jgi:glucose/arabinose dehydrogenase
VITWNRVFGLSTVAAVLWPLAGFVPVLRAAELPSGFTRVTVATGLSQPTAFAFKGEKSFVTEKATGSVRIVRPDGSVRPQPYVTVNVSAESERGLLGIAVDPHFATNRFVYLYYTTGPGALDYTGSPKNRVSRFTSVLGFGTAETILLDNIPSDAGNHNGGDIHFGFDGKLYVAVGDGGQFHDDAQTLDNLRGKILRINPDGIPPDDNPHKHDLDARRCGRPGGPRPGSGPCKEIYAYGLRNPFRFSFRSFNGSYVIADVGQNTWEELNVLVADGNYGWNGVEGPCPVPSNPNCDPNTTPYPPQFEFPIHFYNHSGIGETGQTIIGGAFAENGSNYPAPYAGTYFYGDFSANWIHVLTMDPDNKVTNLLDFATLTQPVAFANGPDGNIYVLSFADGALYKYVFTPQ